MMSQLSKSPCIAISISRKICVNEIGDKVLSFMFLGKIQLPICYHASLKKVVLEM